MSGRLICTLLPVFAAFSLAFPVFAQAGPFAIAIGDTVSNGVPAAGAGNIETPGEQDLYTFAITAGQEVIFDVLSGGAGAFLWRLEAPDNAISFDGLYVDRQLVLAQSGTYTLSVRGGSASATGTYSFRLLPVPTPQLFAITISDTVSANLPTPGAGNLEIPGSLDVYSFSASAGQGVIFDVLSGGAGQYLWLLKAPDGSTLFDGLYVDRQVTLVQAGIYTLTVRGGNVSATGSYSFRLLAVPAAHHFAIMIGDTVSQGVPAAGAGNIETPGAVDLYTFSAVSGQSLIFDALSGDNVDLRWILTAPDSSKLFNTFYLDQQVSVPQTGTYTLTVLGLNITSTALYSFVLLEAPSTQQYTIGFGDTVSNGSPAAGAGNLEVAGAVDVYTFDGTAGQNAALIVLTGHSATFWWMLTAPDSTSLFDVFFTGQQLTLPQTGTYTLTVRGLNVDDFGIYSFALAEFIPNHAPVAEDDNTTTDEDITLEIDVLANDTDADNDSLEVQSVVQPSNGSVVNNVNNVTYTPHPDYNGVDTFTYTVSDGRGGLDSATVNVIVNPRGDDGSIHSTQSIGFGGEVLVTVADSDLTTASIEIEATSPEGESETLILSLAGTTGEYSGMFTVFEIAPTALNSVLESTGGNLTFTYIDEADAGSGVNVPRMADTLVTAAKELLLNGGFEVDNDGDNIPDDWTPKNLSNDKRKCGNQGYNSDCALIFKGKLDEAAKFTQVIADPTVISAGDNLTLSADIWNNRPDAGVIIKVVVKYADLPARDNRSHKDKIQIDLVGPANKVYQTYGETLTATGGASKVKVKLKYKLTSGKVKVDNVSLTHTDATEIGPGHSRTYDILPVPSAPDGFRK